MLPGLGSSRSRHHTLLSLPLREPGQQLLDGPGRQRLVHRNPRGDHHDCQPPDACQCDRDDPGQDSAGLLSLRYGFLDLDMLSNVLLGLRYVMWGRIVVAPVLVSVPV